jgi:hypothetical protein
MAWGRIIVGGSFLFFCLRGMYGVFTSWKRLRLRPHDWLQRICSHFQCRMGSYTSLSYVSFSLLMCASFPIMVHVGVLLLETNQSCVIRSILPCGIFVISCNVFSQFIVVLYRSLVNCITSNQSSQVSLNSCRNAFTMVRCMLIWSATVNFVCRNCFVALSDITIYIYLRVRNCIRH